MAAITSVKPPITRPNQATEKSSEKKQERQGRRDRYRDRCRGKDDPNRIARRRSQSEEHKRASQSVGKDKSRDTNIEKTEAVIGPIWAISHNPKGNSKPGDQSGSESDSGDSDPKVWTRNPLLVHKTKKSSDKRLSREYDNEPKKDIHNGSSLSPRDSGREELNRSPYNSQYSSHSDAGSVNSATQKGKYQKLEEMRRRRLEMAVTSDDDITPDLRASRNARQKLPQSIRIHYSSEPSNINAGEKPDARPAAISRDTQLVQPVGNIGAIKTSSHPMHNGAIIGGNTSAKNTAPSHYMPVRSRALQQNGLSSKVPSQTNGFSKAVTSSANENRLQPQQSKDPRNWSNVKGQKVDGSQVRQRSQVYVSPSEKIIQRYSNSHLNSSKPGEIVPLQVPSLPVSAKPFVKKEIGKPVVQVPEKQTFGPTHSVVEVTRNTIVVPSATAVMVKSPPAVNKKPNPLGDYEIMEFPSRDMRTSSPNMFAKQSHDKSYSDGDSLDELLESNIQYLDIEIEKNRPKRMSVNVPLNIHKPFPNEPNNRPSIPAASFPKHLDLQGTAVHSTIQKSQPIPQPRQINAQKKVNESVKSKKSISLPTNVNHSTPTHIVLSGDYGDYVNLYPRANVSEAIPIKPAAIVPLRSPSETVTQMINATNRAGIPGYVPVMPKKPVPQTPQIHISVAPESLQVSNHMTDISPDTDAGEGLMLPVNDEGMFSDVDYNIEVSERIKKWETYMVKKDDEQKKAPSTQTPPIRKRAILEPIEERREISDRQADINQNMFAAKHLEHVLKKKTDIHMDNFPLHQSLSDTSVNRSFDTDASDCFADFLANVPKRSQDVHLEYGKSPSPVHHHRQRTLFGDEIWDQYTYEQSERKPNRQEKTFSILHPLDISVSQPTLYTPVTTYSSSITVDNSQPYYGVANNTNHLTLEQNMLSTSSQYDNFMTREKDNLRDDDVFEVKSDSVKSLARMFDSKDSPSSPNRDDRSREESRSTRTSVSQQESDSDWTNLITTDLQGKIKDADVWSPNMESDQGLVSMERVKARTLQTVPFSEDPFWKEIEDMTRMDDVFRDKISHRSPTSSAPKSPETRKRHISPLVSSSIYEQGFFPQHDSDHLSVKSRKRPVSLYCPSALPMPKVDRYHSTEALDEVLNDMKLAADKKSTRRKASKMPGAVLSPTSLSILSPVSAEKQVFFPQRYHTSTKTSGSLLDDTIRSLGEISTSKPSGYSHSHENLTHGFSNTKEMPPPPPAPLEGKKEYLNVVNGNYQLDPKILKNKLLSTGLVDYTTSDAETFSNQERSTLSPMYRDPDRDEQMRQSMDDLRILAKEVEVKVDQIKKKILQSREENLDKILVSLRKHVPSASKADMGARNIFVKKDTTKFRKSKLVDALSELERIYEDLDLDNELLMDRAARRELTCLSVPSYEDKSSRKSPLNEAISPYKNSNEEWVKSQAYEPTLNFNHQPDDNHMQEFDAIDRCFQTLLQEVNSYSLGPSPPGQLKRDSSHDSLSSEIRRSRGRKIPYPDKVNDDLATRRFGHSSTPSSKQDFLSPPSYTSMSPVVSPQQNRRSNTLKGGANVILDDVAYRKSRSQSGSRDDNQRTPTAQSPTSADYLKPRSRPGRTRMRLRPEKEPDIMQDDMAYRNLRREEAGPEDFPKPPPRSSSLHRRKLRKGEDMNRRKSMPFEVVDKRTVETQTGDTDTRDDQTSSTSSPAVRRARNREPSSSESSNENKKLRRRSLSRGIARMVDIFSSSDEDKKRRGSHPNTTSKTSVPLKQKENAISKVPANSPSCIRKQKENLSKPVTIAVDTAETANQSQSKSTPRLVKQRHEARQRQRHHRVEIVPKEQVEAKEDLISPAISKTAENSKIEGDAPANPLYPWRKSRSSSLESAAKVEQKTNRIMSAESNSKDIATGVTASHGPHKIDASPPVIRRRKSSNQDIEQLERRWSFHDLVVTFETDSKRIEKLKTLRKATSEDNLVQETVISKTYHSEPDLRKHPDIKTLDISDILFKLEMKVQY